MPDTRSKSDSRLSDSNKSTAKLWMHIYAKGKHKEREVVPQDMSRMEGVLSLEAAEEEVDSHFCAGQGVAACRRGDIGDLNAQLGCLP